MLYDVQIGRFVGKPYAPCRKEVEAMKLKAAITEGTPQEVVDAFSSQEFAANFLQFVLPHLGIKDALDRPAEFYVQRPDRTIAANRRCGVEVRLTGVSRGNRTAKMFHEALKTLDSLVKRTAYEALTAPEQSIQTFVVMMLDDEVETAPGSGIYSCVLEAEPSWQTKGE